LLLHIDKTLSRILIRRVMQKLIAGYRHNINYI